MGSVIWFFDPGQETGWATGWGGELLACGLIRVSRDHTLEFPGYAHAGVKAWIEIPEHRRENNKVDPNDLIALGVKVGRIKERCLLLGYEVSEVRPSGWKGAVPKNIHHQRVRTELSPEESRVLASGLGPIPEGFRHNVLDAVGGFLWAVKKERLR